MTGPLAGLRLAVLERPHPPGHQGAVVRTLVPALAAHGARVEVVHAEQGLHRLDRRPPWDAAVLKSGSAAALHLAAAAEAWGIPAVNPAAGTALTRDKIAATVLLHAHGLPVPPAYGIWVDRGRGTGTTAAVPLAPQADRLVVKAARGSQGKGLWWTGRAGLAALLADLPTGPYLVMAEVPGTGDDLKVYLAGDWIAAIERPFPATSYAAKLGRPVPVPADLAAVARRVGQVLGLTCYGCDFVAGPDGWALVDVNAFPGYKGVDATGPLCTAIAAATGTGAR